MVRAWALLSLFALLACGRADTGFDPSQLAVDYGSLGGDFQLTDCRDRPFALSQLHGQVVLLFFGYTHCPDFCPQTLSRLVAARTLLPADAGFSVVFVTVDPERDTPALLGEYLGYFALDVIGLTGTPDQIDCVARQYGVSHVRREADSAVGYFVDHSTYLFLLDGSGAVRHLFRQDDPPETIAAGLRALLAQTPAAAGQG